MVATEGAAGKELAELEEYKRQIEEEERKAQSQVTETKTAEEQQETKAEELAETAAEASSGTVVFVVKVSTAHDSYNSYTVCSFTNPLTELCFF